ncbi:radical sam [Desulfoluna butyratoxydans]|uniref:Radical sam n=2 Tax=Desulfoluna butyratoxydans TaxID=231438 RepID=A0A4U8YSM0_9BACT|nr:radical sam [Desulfoluna butyratoxydans]
MKVRMNPLATADKRDAPLVLEIKGASLDDGPGIRTVVFLKGCPLDCAWCHNPESKKAGPELSFDAEKCIGCRECLSVCREGALDPGRGPDRSRCTLCMACTEVCPSKALEPVGRTMEPDEVVSAVSKDMPFFDASGGGVTLSGGEPTLFPRYCGELMQGLKARGIHTLLETSGHFSRSAFDAHIRPHTDTVYFDIKLISPEAHKQYCGVGNARILENLEHLLAFHRAGGLELLPRIPLVPGITATLANITAVADHLSALGARKVQLLPYNPLWHGKTVNIGGRVDGVPGGFMAPEEVAQWETCFEKRGIETL